MIANRACFLVPSGLALHLLLATAAPAADPPSSLLGHLSVTVDDGAGTWSIVAHDIELTELLAELEHRTGLAIRVAGRLDRRRSLRLVDATPRRAVREILRGENYVLRPPSRARGGPSGAGSLWVYAGGSNATALEDPDRCADSPRCRPGEPSGSHEEHGPPSADVLAALDDPHTPHAVDLLTRAALADPSAAVRLDAVYGLGELGDEAALPALEDALRDPDARVRREAVAALSDLGGEGAAWALVPALQASDARLREEAVYALGEIGGDAAIVLLRQALADPATTIRETAALMLDELDAAP